MARPAAVAQQAGRRGDHRADDVQAVRAAEHGTRRVPLGDLGRQDGAVGHVGRVAQHEVDPRLQLDEQVVPPDVRGVQHDPAAVGLDVAPGPDQCVGVGLDGVHDGVGPARRHRDGERAGAGAEVDDDGCGHVRDGGEAPLQQQLGLRRGLNTPGPTATVTGPSTAVPRMCCSGSRAARRATSAWSAWTTGGSTSGRIISLPRSTPST
jgi:hypothetical protein